MLLCAIWAQAQGRAIGRQNTLPWHLPEDLQRFKSLTLGCPVIMGRLTWESLPKQPLPGRPNIVVSAQPQPAGDAAHAWAGSLGEGLRTAEGLVRLPIASDGSVYACSGRESPPVKCFLIGGEQLYRGALRHPELGLQRIYITHIDLEVPGADAFAPELGPEWRCTEKFEPMVSNSGLGYRFETWERTLAR